MLISVKSHTENAPNLLSLARAASSSSSTFFGTTRKKNTKKVRSKLERISGKIKKKIAKFSYIT